MRAKKAERRAAREAKAVERRTDREYRVWRELPADARCCATETAAAVKGCLTCLRMYLRGTQSVLAMSSSSISNNNGPWGANRTMAFAAREGQTEALMLVLPCTAAWRSGGPQRTAQAVRDAGLLAASYGHFATTTVRLRALFVEKRLPGAWHARELCDMLATDGRAADLAQALELGATWPRAKSFAARLHIFAPNSSRAECCRIAAAERDRRTEKKEGGDNNNDGEE